MLGIDVRVGDVIVAQFCARSMRSALRVVSSPSQGKVAWSKSLRRKVLQSWVRAS